MLVYHTITSKVSDVCGSLRIFYPSSVGRSRERDWAHPERTGGSGLIFVALNEVLAK